jgi:hypothetical protein
MKKQSYLFVLLLIVASCNFIGKKHSSKDSSEKTIQLNSLDRTSVFNALFKPYVKEWCLWKPTSADSTFPVSSDGFCHTKLEMNLKYHQDSLDKAVIIFGTYEFIEGIMADCHACNPLVSIAIFEKGDDNMWRLEKFVKKFIQAGAYGVAPNFGVSDFGKDWFLQMSDSGQVTGGSAGGYKEYFHLPDLTSSITIRSENDINSNTKESTITNFTERIFDISDKSGTKVRVVKSGRDYNEGNGQSYINKRTEYLLNDSCIFRPVRR